MDTHIFRRDVLLYSFTLGGRLGARHPRSLHKRYLIILFIFCFRCLELVGQGPGTSLLDEITKITSSRVSVSRWDCLFEDDGALGEGFFEDSARGVAVFFFLPFGSLDLFLESFYYSELIRVKVYLAVKFGPTSLSLRSLIFPRL